MLKEYYQWFKYTQKIFKEDYFITNLSDDIRFSIFVDTLMQQVKICREEFPDIIIYLDNIDDEFIQENKFESESDSEYD